MVTIVDWWVIFGVDSPEMGRLVIQILVQHPTHQDVRESGAHSL